MLRELLLSTIIAIVPMAIYATNYPPSPFTYHWVGSSNRGTAYIPIPPDSATYAVYKAMVSEYGKQYGKR